MSDNRCIYKGCSKIKGDRPDNFLSWLPVKYPERLKVWLVYSGNEHLLSASNEDLRTKVICSKHFAEDMIDPVTKVNVIANAVPIPIWVVNPDEPEPPSDEPPQSADSPSPESSEDRTKMKAEVVRYVVKHVLKRQRAEICTESMMSLRPAPDPEKALIRGEARSAGAVKAPPKSDTKDETAPSPSSSAARRSSSPVAGPSTSRLPEPPSDDAEFKPRDVGARYAHGTRYRESSLSETASAPPVVPLHEHVRMRETHGTTKQVDSEDDTVADESLPSDPQSSLSQRSSIAADSIDLVSPEDEPAAPSGHSQDQAEAVGTREEPRDSKPL